MRNRFWLVVVALLGFAGFGSASQPGYQARYTITSATRASSNSWLMSGTINDGTPLGYTAAQATTGLLVYCQSPYGDIDKYIVTNIVSKVNPTLVCHVQYAEPGLPRIGNPIPGKHIICETLTNGVTYLPPYTINQIPEILYNGARNLIAGGTGGGGQGSGFPLTTNGDLAGFALTNGFFVGDGQGIVQIPVLQNATNAQQVQIDGLKVSTNALQGQATALQTATNALQGAVDELKRSTNALDGVDASLRASTNYLNYLVLDQSNRLVRIDGSSSMQGNLDLNGFRVINLAPALYNTDAVTYQQLLTAIQGLTWLDPIIDVASTPPDPVVNGMRYIVGTNATGAWSGWSTYVVQATNVVGYTNWAYQVPDNGWVAAVKAKTNLYVFGENSWVAIIPLQQFNFTSGLVQNGNSVYVNYGLGLMVSNALLRPDMFYFDGLYAPLSETNRAYNVETNLQGQIVLLQGATNELAQRNPTNWSLYGPQSQVYINRSNLWGAVLMDAFIGNDIGALQDVNITNVSLFELHAPNNERMHSLQMLSDTLGYISKADVTNGSLVGAYGLRGGDTGLGLDGNDMFSFAHFYRYTNQVLYGVTNPVVMEMGRSVTTNENTGTYSFSRLLTFLGLHGTNTILKMVVPSDVPVVEIQGDLQAPVVTRLVSATNALDSRAYTLEAATNSINNVQGSLLFATNALNTRMGAVEASTNALQGEVDLINRQTRSFLNVGVYSKPIVTNVDNQLFVSSGDYQLFTNADNGGVLNRYTIGQTNIYLATNLYTYLVADYNNGNPVITTATDSSTINGSSRITVGSAFYEIYDGFTNIHVVTGTNSARSTAAKISNRLIETERFAHISGSALSSTNLTFSISSGAIWYDAMRITLPPYASTVGLVHFYYHTNGVWTALQTNQLSNLLYDDGQNLQALSGPKTYSVCWVYQCVADTADAFYTLGSGNYTITEALNSQPPTPPTLVARLGLLVGRVIYQNGVTAPYQVDSAFVQTFETTPVQLHNNLGGLQGIGPDYYHLSFAESNLVNSTNALNTRMVSAEAATNNLNSNQINVLAATNSMTIRIGVVETNMARRNGEVFTGPVTNIPGYYGNAVGMTNQPLNSGFVDTNNTITFTASNRTFTITPTGPGSRYVTGGKWYQLATTNVVISTNQGGHHIYFTTAGDLIDSIASWSISGEAQVSEVYWDNHTTNGLYTSDERHGNSMSDATHKYLHLTAGTRWSSGGSLLHNAIASGNPAANGSNTCVAMTSVTIADEDLTTTITPSKQNLGNQTSLGTTNDAGYFPVFYATNYGGVLTWAKRDPQPFPMPTTAAGVPQYNLLSGGNWTLATPSANTYYVMWIYAGNETGSNGVFVIPHHTTYGTLALAQAGALPETVFANRAFDFSDELKLMYRLIFLYNTTAAFTINNRFSRLSDVVDYRVDNSRPLANTPTTVHGSLAGLGDDNHPQYLLTDGTRTLTGPQYFSSDCRIGLSGTNLAVQYLVGGTWTNAATFTRPNP